VPDGDKPTPSMTTTRRSTHEISGRTSAAERWTAWIQALGAVLAVLLAAPALFISLDTLRDQQRINEQTGINLSLERERYRKRYASRVSWWKTKNTWWERNMKTPNLPRTLGEKPLNAVIQNRSTVPATNVQIAFIGPGASDQSTDPFMVRIERNCPGGGRTVDQYLCTETEVLKTLTPYDSHGWRWYLVDDIPPCTIVEVANPDERSAEPKNFIPTKIAFSDPDERWIKDGSNPMRSLKIDNWRVYSSVDDGRMLPLGGKLPTTIKGEASDCTDQT
jgi:hypothetical protein